MRIFSVLLWAVSIAYAQSAELSRHGVIGLTVAAPDSTRPEDSATNPPTVRAVAPGSAAEAAGIQVGDIVREVDGASVASSADFAARIGQHLAGDRVAVLLSRGGLTVTKTAVLKPRPYESSPDAEVLYRSVTVEDARRRVIVTRPKATGRHSAVLLIGGLGCYSLDGELSNPTGYGPILTALVKKDFVTMRVEKSGQGDSEGPPCADPKATAELEAKAYVAGLRTLKKYEFVDPEGVFIFAHSLGPLIGSMVIVQEPVRGFIAAETIGRSWFEYTLGNMRRQAALVGQLPDQVDARVRAETECGYHFFVQHEKPEELIKIGPACEDMIRSYAGVPYTYMQQIGDLSLGAQWKQVDIPVLVIYGDSDPATSADESRYLADLINRFHAGRATYVELKGMGHDFGLYESQLEFLRRRGDGKTHPFDEEVTRVVLQWLGNHGGIH